MERRHTIFKFKSIHANPLWIVCWTKWQICCYDWSDFLSIKFQFTLLQIFFKIFYFMFRRRRKYNQVWNIRVNKWCAKFHIWVHFTFKTWKGNKLQACSVHLASSFCLLVHHALAVCLLVLFVQQEAGSCGQCGGSGCAPCSLCHGSKRSMLANRFNESIRELRCPACNPHGLERCQSCTH